MLFIHNTVSLCNECYRHIPAIVYEEDGLILIKKNCPYHGEYTGIVETDPAFYYGLEHHRDVSSFNQVLFEASDRCQLTCPHCYHLPDNKIKDVQLDILISQINQFPKDSSPMIAGAEPTLRPDFIKLCNELDSLNFEQFELLTNGIRFASKEFTDSCYQAGLKTLCFGLNHPSYQGDTVHNKQLTALDNLIDRKIGEIELTGDSTLSDFIPFDSLTEANIIEWVKAFLGEEQVTSIETNLQTNVVARKEAQDAQTTKQGLPWRK